METTYADFWAHAECARSLARRVVKRLELDGVNLHAIDLDDIGQDIDALCEHLDRAKAIRGASSDSAAKARLEA